MYMNKLDLALNNLQWLICHKTRPDLHLRGALNGKKYGELLRMFTCGKCGQKIPDHIEEDCANATKCSNCQENHSAFSRTCNREGNCVGKVLKKL